MHEILISPGMLRKKNIYIASSFPCRKNPALPYYSSPMNLLTVHTKLHFWSPIVWKFAPTPPSNSLSPEGIPLNSDTVYLEQASDCRGGLNSKRLHKSPPHAFD